MLETLPFLIESLAVVVLLKLSEFAVSRRGRSTGNPSLRCRDLLISTVSMKGTYERIKIKIL